jgi:hypothetical protein
MQNIPKEIFSYHRKDTNSSSFVLVSSCLDSLELRKKSEITISERLLHYQFLCKILATSCNCNVRINDVCSKKKVVVKWPGICFCFR